MNTKRIEEIQKETAYPDSISVQHALFRVWRECEQEKVVKNLRIADVLALDIATVSGSALAKVEQYNQLKKEMQEEILHLKTIIDDLSYLFNIGTVEERKELQIKISKLEWAVYQMKHCI